jgi:hypothetical protein
MLHARSLCSLLPSMRASLIGSSLEVRCEDCVQSTVAVWHVPRGRGGFILVAVLLLRKIIGLAVPSDIAIVRSRATVALSSLLMLASGGRLKHRDDTRLF